MTNCKRRGILHVGEPKIKKRNHGQKMNNAFADADASNVDVDV